MCVTYFVVHFMAAVLTGARTPAREGPVADKGAGGVITYVGKTMAEAGHDWEW